MKKIFLYGFMLSALLVGTTSCESALDINRDPNLPVNASAEVLFPSGVAQSAARIGGDMQLIGSIWSQHYTQNNTSNQYKTIDAYTLDRTHYNGIWSGIWAGGLQDLKYTQEAAKAAGQTNFVMAASIMSAFDYHILVDFYGAIPYKEGLNASNPQPKWDEGKDVNILLVKQLDDAIAMATDASKVASMGKADFLFEGSIANWVKFAKTLKLKILMRDFITNSTAIQALLTEGNLLNVDAKMSAFEDKESKSNPLYESDQRKLNTNTNLKASKTLLSFLQDNNDPRIPDFYLENNDTEQAYIGLPQGDFLHSSTDMPINKTSRAKLEATDAVYFMSAAESAFLQAEAWARLNDAVKAKTAYDNGVKLAFTRWGHDGSSFVGPGGKYEFKGTATLATQLEQIITQKWIAAARSQAWDSFFDQNRTGFPQISSKTSEEVGYVSGQYTVSVNTSLVAGEIPRRIAYPKNSADYNVNTPAVVPIYTKMWWHK